MTVSSPERAASLRPQRLIVTVFGAFLRDLGGWVAVADLVQLMAELGVDNQAVRSSVSRLKRREFILAERRGTVAGYRLSPEANRILEAGDRRIYRLPVSEEDDRWVLAVFSVPEERRSERHVLRSRLEWLGFGNVAPGVWIAPSHVELEVREALERLELSRYVTLFLTEMAALDQDLKESAARWWDLESLANGYRWFVEQHEPLLRSLRRRTPPSDAEAFAGYVRVVTLWRRLPFFDPGLPRPLLADDWPGNDAVRLFHALRERLAAPAERHVAEVTGLRRLS